MSNRQGTSTGKRGTCLTEAEGEDSRSDHGLRATVQGAHSQCCHEAVEGGDGLEASPNDVAFNGETTVWSNGGPDGRLCLEHMEPRVWKLRAGGTQPDAENGITSHHGDVSHGGDRHRRSRSEHTDGPHAT